jgi:hypothetical protein
LRLPAKSKIKSRPYWQATNMRSTRCPFCPRPMKVGIQRTTVNSSLCLRAWINDFLPATRSYSRRFLISRLALRFRPESLTRLQNNPSKLRRLLAHKFIINQRVNRDFSLFECSHSINRKHEGRSAEHSPLKSPKSRNWPASRCCAPYNTNATGFGLCHELSS